MFLSTFLKFISTEGQFTAENSFLSSILQIDREELENSSHFSRISHSDISLGAGA